MSLIARIQKVINDSELSAAAFADKIGVQRSSISHILSGRNKPSLDFILKILQAFPTVQSNWLLLGGEPKTTEPTLFPQEAPKTPLPTAINQDETPTPSPVTEAYTPTDAEVERVTVFYSDGTCSTYTNKK